MGEIFKVTSKGISIFLPVYNEEKILAEHVEQVYNAAKKLKRPFELVVVDDSSTDSTPKIAKELCKKHKGVFHKRFENGPSRRENLAVAMKQAKYDLVTFMDLDLATPLIFFPGLIKEIEGGADIAIGSRRIQGAEAKRDPYRAVWSFLYHKTINLLFNSKIKDYQCGFKVFRKKALVDLSKKIGYDSQLKRGWFWDAELLINAEKLGYKIGEIPVSWKEGEKSAFNLTRELKVPVYILKHWFKINQFSL